MKILKRKISLTIITVTGLFLFFIGCDLPNEIDLRGIEDATGYFKLVLENEEFFTSEEAILFDSEGGLNKKSANVLTLQTSHHQIRRVIESRDITTDIGETEAIVTLVRTIKGELILDLSESSGEQQTIKPFSENATRKAKFHRVRNTGIPDYDWKLVELSLLSGGASNDHFSIDSLRVQFDETFPIEMVDPLNKYFRIGQGDVTVPTIAIEHFISKGVRISITLRSSDEEAEHVFLRHGGVFPGRTGGYMVRTQLELQNERELDDELYKYERSYFVHWEPVPFPPHLELRPGRFSAIVEALSHEALSDGDAQVVSKYWGVPFVVE